MPHRHLLAAAAALSLVATAAAPALAQDVERPHGPPEATPNPVAMETPAGDGTAVRLTTELGDIVIGLFNESAPVAAENFLNLASEGFYDDIGFHRSEPDFVLQGGDPTGTGGGGPDYRIDDEEVVGEYVRGIVAMARSSGRNTQGSQFFFILDDDAEGALEAYRTYVIFGRVVEGMDVVDAIVEAREPSDRIPDPVRITEASIEEAELPPEPTPEPGERVTRALRASMPAEVEGIDLELTVFKLEQIGSQFDPDIIAELAEISEAAGADLELFALAQASGGGDSGFANVLAVSIPGVSAEEAQDAVARLLIPGADLEGSPTETLGGRETRSLDLGDGMVAHVFGSGDVVWFVIAEIEDVDALIASLP